MGKWHRKAKFLSICFSLKEIKKRDYVAYTAYIQGINDPISRPLKKKVFYNIQKPFKKMASRLRSTMDKQIPTQKSGFYKISLLLLRGVYRAKQPSHMQ
jgi:hypothetical protein